MSDVRDSYGNVVYRIEGDRINDTYGNWKYTIVGDRINDASGSWKYSIRGEYLYDTYGNRLGEMKNLAELLGASGVGDDVDYSSRSSHRSDDGPGGCLGAIFGLLYFIFKANWGGKIGIILGVIFIIGSLATGTGPDGANFIFGGLFVTFLFGIVGAIIGAIVKAITKK